jgi:hypothetical protein
VILVSKLTENWIWFLELVLEPEMIFLKQK